MSDEPIPDPTRVLARLQAHAAATRTSDPRCGEIDPLRWIDHDSVVAIVRASRSRMWLIVEVTAEGTTRPFALTDAQTARSFAIHRPVKHTN
ncbi:hypothetical protein [Candidatus Poriferisodalis sp.]|uniref:hypothetical protein n=1 Tax=Candidatus Poriferisodalis sp. TaxID=3101277 RepID=UPI003C6FE462